MSAAAPTAPSSWRCSCGAVILLLVVSVQCFIVAFNLYKDDAKRMICHAAAGEGSAAFADADASRTEQFLRNSNATRSSSSGADPGTTWDSYITSTEPLVFDGVAARAFEPWNASRNGLPCFAPETNWRHSDHAPCDSGFIFVKPYKVGSSTASGINLRVARGAARRLGRPYDVCKARYDHTWASDSYRNYKPDQTYLWTILRDPDTRVVSQFFHFEVSRKKVEPSDENFIRDVRDPANADYLHDYYISALSLQPYRRGSGATEARAHANSILARYNFVGLTERMDESAVVLAMLLDLSVADTLYLAAKTHGGWDDAGGRTEGNICTYIVPSFVSAGMAEFLASDEWRGMSHWDRALWRAANRSLDLTIDRLGRPEVERNLQLYLMAKAKAQEVCLHKTRFPCSEGGKYNYGPTDCMWKDSGCGMDCLDEVAASLGL